MRFTSIIVTHYAQDEERSKLFRDSLESLFTSTDEPYELIIIDNGPNFEDSKYLANLAHNGKINVYVRNHNNMHFGYARNQGYALSNGDYVAFCDNDIIYKKDWLRACIDVLEAYPNKKIYATPVYNVAHWLPKYWNGETLKVGNEEYRLNARAGSNCFVIRRRDFTNLRLFKAHRVAGTKWTEHAICEGYMAAVAPNYMIKDAGFRKGYNYKMPLPVRITLSNGKEVYFNNDEFRKNNCGLQFIQQKASGKLYS